MHASITSVQTDQRAPHACLPVHAQRTSIMPVRVITAAWWLKSTSTSVVFAAKKRLSVSVVWCLSILYGSAAVIQSSN